MGLKCRSFRHSREGGNPGPFSKYMILKAERWTPAFAGVTVSRGFLSEVGISVLFQQPARASGLPASSPPLLYLQSGSFYNSAFNSWKMIYYCKPAACWER